MNCPDLAFTAQALAWALAATIAALVICLAIIGRVTLRRAARHPLAPADPMAAPHGDVPAWLRHAPEAPRS